eukprot:SAG22_NODE_1611_length_4001_cov_1.991287_6_plen_247_part_00
MLMRAVHLGPLLPVGALLAAVAPELAAAQRDCGSGSMPWAATAASGGGGAVQYFVVGTDGRPDCFELPCQARAVSTEQLCHAASEACVGTAAWCAAADHAGTFANVDSPSTPRGCAVVAHSSGDDAPAFTFNEDTGTGRRAGIAPVCELVLCSDATAVAGQCVEGADVLSVTTTVAAEWADGDHVAAASCSACECDDGKCTSPDGNFRSGTDCCASEAWWAEPQVCARWQLQRIHRLCSPRLVVTD